jgi:hypothetical protein
VSGQKLSIEAVPDGRYALRSVADPENRLAESDPDNNGAIVYLQIDGDEVEEIDEKQPRPPPRRQNPDPCRAMGALCEKPHTRQMFPTRSPTIIEGVMEGQDRPRNAEERRFWSIYDGRVDSVGRATARMVVPSAQFLGVKACGHLFSGLAGGAVSG